MFITGNTGFPKAQSCLKPACEDWWLVRKPGRGVEPLGIDECRIGTESTIRPQNHGPTWSGEFQGGRRENGSDAGRWPANVVLDEEAAAMLDEQSGLTGGRDNRGYLGGQRPGGFANTGANSGDSEPCGQLYGDSGGASRFFYVPKASKSDRGEGNTHPTVKSTALMEWLVKLVCPEKQTVLDPFMGSGSTAVACRRAGRKFIGIESNPEYFDIACRRIEKAYAEPAVLGG